MLRQFFRSRLFFLMIGTLTGSTFTANPGFTWVHISLILSLLIVSMWAVTSGDAEKETDI